jgi:hypothetical protein
VPLPFDISCFEFQLRKYVGAVVVYGVRKQGQANKVYCGKIEVDSHGNVGIRLTERFNYIPTVEKHVAFQHVPFPVQGFEYEYMVSVGGTSRTC